MELNLWNYTETQAKIEGEVDHFVKVGGTLRLTCRVYLGNAGPDDIYAKTAVIHWFHDQRLLDPDLENWKNIRAMSNPAKAQRGPMHVEEIIESSKEVFNHIHQRNFKKCRENINPNSYMT